MLPENAGIDGPTVVEEDIDKNTTRYLRNWKEANNVIRGNLLIVPVENALFYLEAIYLQSKPVDADDNKPRRPKLEMVILKSGANELDAVPAKTFDEALNFLMFGLPMNGEVTENGEKALTVRDILQQIRQANEKNGAEMDQLFKQLGNLIEEEDR